MSEKKSPKKGGIRLEPMQGKFFDIRPSKKGTNPPQLGRRSDFFLFAIVTLVAFLFLSIGNAYVLGREMIFEGQENAYEGYESIKLGAESLLAKNAAAAKTHFLEAEASFQKLSQTAEPIISQNEQFMSEGLYLDAANKLIESALEVTQIGQELSELMLSFNELPQAMLAMAGGEDGGLVEALKERKIAFDEILAMAASLQRKMATINDDILPEDLRRKIASARTQIGQMMAALLEVDENFDVLLSLLGDDVPHRYLLLFQNNHELRATGGFIGSYMIVDVNDGKISKMETKDVYETDGQLHDMVDPPPGIDQVADRLYMRDANYSPDFPTSAQSIMWFLEHSKGPSVDTVIAIDQNVVEGLLELTGPVVLPSFPFQIRAGNFSDIISFYTEAKLSESATPKQLLFDLIPVLQKKIPDLSETGRLIDLGKKLIKEGHVQMYSMHPGVQELIVRIGLDGAIEKPAEKKDYLSVITTAIGGNKSDEYMHMQLHHLSHISEKGKIEDVLTIKKTHTWNHHAETKLANLISRYGTGALGEESAYFILGRGPNVDYMRVYVPKGSALQDASGIDLTAIEVSEDLDWTVFAFTLGPINAGDEKEVTIRYLLPFNLSFHPEDSYQFVAEKQAGAENITLKKEIILPDSLIVTNSNPISSNAFSLIPIFETELNRNQTFVSDIALVR
ncbi:DUF4012 domain-containing protein [Candidatus Peregrinibacteria bacterium]|nr:DUF4012 domain-containing protein [Candidatus Peregrinibacteria bacterium]